MINYGKALAHMVLVRGVMGLKAEDNTDNLINSGPHVSFFIASLISFAIN